MMKSTTAIRLGSASAARGEKAWGQLRIRQAGVSTALPVAVIVGEKDGPHAVFLANQHGAELNGFESIRRAVSDIDPARLKGSVFAVASANPRGAMLGESDWPEAYHEQLLAKHGKGPYKPIPGAKPSPYDLNMNRNWPGDKNGLFVRRVAHELWTHAVMADHGRAHLLVDLHSHQNRTAVYAEDAVATDLGVVSGVRNVVKTRFSGTVTTSNTVCRMHGIPSITIELQGQRKFVPASVEEGRIALLNLLKFYRMLPGKPRLGEEAWIVDPWRDDETNKAVKTASNEKHFARRAGLFVPRKDTYDRIRKGDLLGEVVDAYTGRTLETHESGMTGILYGMHLSGVCDKGDRLFVVASARKVRPRDYVRRLDPAKLRPEATDTPT